jgi:hypothetical protein
MDEQENTPTRETVRLRHPHTGDIQEVEATPEKLVPLMGLGYVRSRRQANNMPARVQQLIMGLGKGKQTNISTAGSTFLRFKKLDTGLTTPKPVFENDAAEIGKGHEFITQTFPSHYEIANRLDKYASAEFVTWAVAFALGNITQTGSVAPYTYTITPINPGVTLELPYFSLVEQVAEGGGNAIDDFTSAARSRTSPTSSITVRAARRRR